MDFGLSILRSIWNFYGTDPVLHRPDITGSSNDFE